MSTFFIFPGMFEPHIKEGTMPMPKNLEDFNNEEYPHWAVFCTLFCSQPIDVGDIQHNADIIGNLSLEEIKKVTIEDLTAKGLVYGNPNYIV